MGQRHFVGDCTGDWRGMVWWINRSIARLTRYADSALTISPFLFLNSAVASCVSLAGAGKYAREAGGEKLY